jgi:hypothetical protein
MNFSTYIRYFRGPGLFVIERIDGTFKLRKSQLGSGSTIEEAIKDAADKGYDVSLPVACFKFAD